MIRRLGTSVIGVVLLLPLATVAPVAAHTTGGLTFTYGTVTTVDGTTVAGFVENHTGSRQTSIQVTATWRSGGTVMASESGPAMVSNLAPHSSSPFELFESTVVNPLWNLTLTATSSVTNLKPTGALSVASGSFTATNTYEGTVTNLGALAAQNVQVYTVRQNGSITDAAASGVIPSIAAGATATYTINFDPASTGTNVEYLTAKTNSGEFYASWNNYFGDLGNSSFAAAIAWMADEGITTGCGNANFCPSSSVTRAQMAVFLTRALDLPSAGDQGFTDLAGQSEAFVDAINSLAAAGITGGCSTSPLKFCPGQTVTRGQMSKFLVTGYGGPGGKDIAPIPGAGPFTDDNGNFSEPYNNAMADAGITGGCGVAKYCPGSAVLREQMAIFMLRASELPNS